MSSKETLAAQWIDVGEGLAGASGRFFWAMPRSGFSMSPSRKRNFLAPARRRRGAASGAAGPAPSGRQASTTSFVFGSRIVSGRTTATISAILRIVARPGSGPPCPGSRWPRSGGRAAPRLPRRRRAVRASFCSFSTAARTSLSVRWVVSRKRKAKSRSRTPEEPLGSLLEVAVPREETHGLRREAPHAGSRRASPRGRSRSLPGELNEAAGGELGRDLAADVCPGGRAPGGRRGRWDPGISSPVSAAHLDDVVVRRVVGRPRGRGLLAASARLSASPPLARRARIVSPSPVSRAPAWKPGGGY